MGWLTSVVFATGLAQAAMSPPPPPPSKTATDSVEELIITAPSQMPGSKLNLDVKRDFAQ